MTTLTSRETLGVVVVVIGPLNARDTPEVVAADVGGVRRVVVGVVRVTLGQLRNVHFRCKIT